MFPIFHEVAVLVFSLVAEGVKLLIGTEEDGSRSLQRYEALSSTHPIVGGDFERFFLEIVP